MSPDRTLDQSLSVREGRLFVEGCAADRLAERFGTPLYVISEDQLRRNARAFRGAFEPRWPGSFLLLPSIKANSALALRHVLNEEGTGCDVFGPGELEAALGTGTDPDRISLNGPMKDEAILERAVGAGVRITLDSAAELERAAAVAGRLGRRAHVRFRMRPDLASFETPSEMATDGSSVREAVQRYKAGIPTQDLVAIEAAAVADSRIDAAGLMLHIGRHLTDPAVWSSAADAMAATIAELREAWDGWTPRELDLGGGFPAPRDPFGRTLPQRHGQEGPAPSAEDYAEAIVSPLTVSLKQLGIDPGDVQLEIEPGRALYADAGVHLATVGNVKRQTEPMPLTWVETDSSDAYLADVNLEHNRWTCIAAGRADEPAELTADITGRTCALDVIVADAELPGVRVGDVLAFLDTGAYQDAGASNFNALPRPGTVLVTGDEAEVIKRRETLEEVFARDVVPERLGGPEGWRATALDHVSVSCADLDRSLGFYCELLGLPLRGRGEAEGAEEFEITGIADARVRWADIELRRGQVLELIEYVEPRGNPVRPQTNDPGAMHISMRVSDIAAVHARLGEAGVETRTAPVEITDPGPWQGARAFYASDPDGVTVELIQTPPGWEVEARTDAPDAAVSGEVT